MQAVSKAIADSSLSQLVHWSIINGLQTAALIEACKKQMSWMKAIYSGIFIPNISISTRAAETLRALFNCSSIPVGPFRPPQMCRQSVTALKVDTFNGAASPNMSFSTCSEMVAMALKKCLVKATRDSTVNWYHASSAVRSE